MTDPIQNLTIGAKYLEKVIHEYAETPDRLTRQECQSVGISESSCKVLVNSLSYGQGGVITQEEQNTLRNAGFSNNFIQELTGNDGQKALQNRIRWLADNAITKWCRWDYDEITRMKMVDELGDIGWYELVCDTAKNELGALHALKKIEQEEELGSKIHSHAFKIFNDLGKALLLKITKDEENKYIPKENTYAR